MSNSGTKTGLFLIELVVALLLFAFCAAICMQLFVAARGRTRDSDNLSQGVYIVTSAAECYKNSGGRLKDVQTLLGGEISGQGLVVSYDRNWEKTTGSAAFLLVIRDGGGVAEISVYEPRRDGIDGVSPGSSEDLIYSITVRAVMGVA